MNSETNDSTMQLQKLLFLHIQKTAGTSVVKTLARFYPHSWISHYDHASMTPSQVQKTEFVSGHFGFGYAKQFKENRYFFTFLREPRERILSFYRFCRAQDPSAYQIYEIARSNTLDRFLDLAFEVPTVRGCLWNHQTWQLANGWSNPERTSVSQCRPELILKQAEENIGRFSFVGFVCRIDQDLPALMKEIGLPNRAVAIPRANSSEISADLKQLNATTLKKLDRLVELDSQIYNAAWNSRFY